MNTEQTLMSEYKLLSGRYSSLMVDDKGNILNDTPETKAIRERMWAIVDEVKALQGYHK